MSYPQQPWGAPQGWGPPAPPPKPPQSNTTTALAAIGAIVVTCLMCAAFGRSSGDGGNSPTNSLSSLRPAPPRPEVVARSRAEAAQTVREARAGIAPIREHLAARRLDEAIAAINGVEGRFQSVAAMQPPPDGLAEARAELAPVAAEVRGRLVARNAPTNALAHVGDRAVRDWLAYDALLESDINTLRGIPAEYRAGSEAALRSATQAVERRRREIRRQVQTARREAAERMALSAVCGDAAPALSGWDGELPGSEAYLRRTAHDPDSIDVENCTQPVLTRRLCWVSTCQVRGRNAFGGRVLNRVTFSVGRAGIMGAQTE